jgi:archaemetzincin
MRCTLTTRTSAILLSLLLAACSREHRIRKIVLVPIGPVPANVLANLERDLPPLLQREVTIGQPIPRASAAFDRKRQQYRGSALLQELERYDVVGVDRVVGIIDADAYAPGLNFIFGQANKPGRVAVVALPRLRDSFRGRPDDPVRFRERVLKVTVHELGHAFGFAHCADRTCVMHFANSLREADQTGSHYCTSERLPK